MTLLALFLLGRCLNVSSGSDRVTARDLATEFPVLAEVSPDTPLAFAPAPGIVRWFRMPELGRIASVFGVTPPDHEICVERATAPPTLDSLRSAMRNALPNAHIEVLEFNRAPIPVGELRFPIEGLQPGPATSVWNGYVLYAPNRRQSIWTRVKVQVEVRRVIALRDLPPSRSILPEEVRVEVREETPRRTNFAETAEQTVGRCSRAPIRSGTPIRVELLGDCVAVTRGALVRVAVQNGPAHLELEATAETSGAVGSLVRLRNPSSNRVFYARVDGTGRASVETFAPKTNP
jgi:flagella basal body P-ring formation protein FlgA